MADTWNVKMEYDGNTIAEIKQDESKSPMDKLSEILRRNNKRDVEYNLVLTNFTPHGRLFIVKASNCDLTATGRGLSENSAKTNAAMVLLNTIYDQVDQNACFTSSSYLNRLDSMNQYNEEAVFDNNNGFSCYATTPDTHYFPSQKVTKYPEENNLTAFSAINYIGFLQEFCIAHHLPIPKYTFSQETDENHTISFEAICLVSSIETSGKGKTKQLAKRNAAREIFMQIKSLSAEEIERHQTGYNHKSPTMPLVSNNKFSCNIQMSSKSLEHLCAFIKQLEENETNNPVDFLESIGNKEGFSAKYVNVFNGTRNNKVIVQLTTTPVIVCLGSGETVNEAQISAAVTMLTYLKLAAKH